MRLQALTADYDNQSDDSAIAQAEAAIPVGLKRGRLRWSRRQNVTGILGQLIILRLPDGQKGLAIQRAAARAVG